MRDGYLPRTCLVDCSITELSSYLHSRFTVWLILLHFLAFTLVCFPYADPFNRVNQLGIVLTYIDVGAIAAGISPDFSFYLVSIANASSGLGRIMTGIAVDKFGMRISLAIAIMTELTFARPCQCDDTNDGWCGYNDICMALRKHQKLVNYCCNSLWVSFCP